MEQVGYLGTWLMFISGCINICWSEWYILNSVFSRTRQKKKSNDKISETN